MKTGVHPMRVKLKLFFKWGIEFDKDNPYTVDDNGGREVKYAEKKDLLDGIIRKYHPEELEEREPSDDDGTYGGQAQRDSEKHEPQVSEPKGDDKKGKGGGIKTVAPSNRAKTPTTEVNPNEPT